MALGPRELASPEAVQDRSERPGDAPSCFHPALVSVIIRTVPEDHDAEGQEDDLPDDGLSDVPGRKRIAELPILASLYLQVLGPKGTRGTSEPSATGFVLRDADSAPHLITNRHVMTGQNSLNGLKVPDNSPAISALRSQCTGQTSSAPGCPSRCAWVTMTADRTGWSTPITGHVWTSSRCR